MKEVLTQRLAKLKEEYQKLEADRGQHLQAAEECHQKMLFLSGAFEEIKLLIKNHFPEVPPCEPQATSKTN